MAERSQIKSGMRRYRLRRQKPTWTYACLFDVIYHHEDIRRVAVDATYGQWWD
ncbi:predicted protein [Histoplasma mississippiense (nom. inval.)]|uniref:predicted protein n=1 Tax=Ajellomyces capsulatus (strain NAm1 / WU24) TaxID=2059318 RepID=UPI000157BF5B|nr:predicted protein [Histoplasma mississippiense (nom. inval.)]EDN06790.1 predicted protein [Histoplasma mississippiense (nom. inval.)]